MQIRIEQKETKGTKKRQMRFRGLGAFLCELCGLLFYSDLNFFEQKDAKSAKERVGFAFSVFPSFPLLPSVESRICLLCSPLFKMQLLPAPDGSSCDTRWLVSAEGEIAAGIYQTL